MLRFLICGVLFTGIMMFYGVMPCHGRPSRGAVELTGGIDSLGVIVGDTLKNPKQLGEVTVAADLNRSEGNKDIIMITKAMREGTHNSGELLGKVAGMMYNPLSTELTYRGSKNIVVLVNGVRKDEGYIKRLNPDRFSKIEITNMPTGLYAGYDAVIDLYTKPLYTGYEGTLLTQEFMAPEGRNGRGKFLKDSRSIGQITYTREKFNFDFVTGYTFSQQGMSDYYTTEYPLNGITESTVETPLTQPNKNSRSSKYSADVSVDYEINRRHSLSARVKLTPASSHENIDNIIERTNSNTGATTTLHELQKNNDRNRMDILGGLWYRGRVDAWRLNAVATYTNISYDRERYIWRSTGYELGNDRKISSRYFSGGAEATRYLFDKKWLLSLTDNVILTDYTEKRLATKEKLSESKDFRNTLNVAMQYTGNEKLSASVNAGVTVFHNSCDGVSDTHVSPKFGAMAMWFPSKGTIVRLNYSVSTSYPSLSSLQDYGQFTDSLMYSIGNPNLKPVLNHDLSLTTTFFNSLTLSARLNHSANAIFGYYSPREGVIPSGADTYYTQYSPVNGKSTTWSLNLTYSKALGSHWQFSVTGGVKGLMAGYGGDKSSKVLPEYDWYVMYHLMGGSLRFYLSGSMSNLNYFTPQDNVWFLDASNALSVEKYFLNDKLSVMAMWYIPISFHDGKNHGGINSVSYRKRYWADNGKRIYNTLSVAVVYRFNSGKSVRKYDRDNVTVEL